MYVFHWNIFLPNFHSSDEFNEDSSNDSNGRDKIRIVLYEIEN